MRTNRFSCVGKVVFGAALFVLVFGLPVQAAQWTFMVYIGGDNNLSTAAVNDIEEMRAATSSADVNVVVQMELSAEYTLPSDLPAYVNGQYTTHRLVIANGQVSAQNIGNQNMGDPATLTAFIQWGATNYPASKYALTIWDHGGGWKKTASPAPFMRGAVADDTSGSFMSLAQLGQGVKNAGVHLNLLDFDACLMAMYEVAYEFIGAVDIMVFSEETEPGNGNPYTPVLNALAANPAMDARSLANIIVTDFVNSYVNGRNSVTKSAVDINQMSSLHASLLDLAQSMRSSIATAGAAINSARMNTQSYEYAANLDLVHLLNNLSSVGGDIGAKAGQVSAMLTSSVVTAEGHYSSTATEGGYMTARNVDNSHGLAIFFPSAQNLEQGEFDAYAALSCNAGGNGWSAFLTDILSYTGGSGATQGSVSNTNGGFALAAWWTDDYGWGAADVDLYVLEPDGNFACPWFGQTTNNGYFSEDSADSGSNYETYMAQDQIMPGQYWMIFNYYDDYYDGYYWIDHAYVYALLYDPNLGHTGWNFVYDQPYYMNLYSPAPVYWDYNVLMGIYYGYYSDWQMPGYVQRGIMSLTLEQQAALMENLKKLTNFRNQKRAQHNMQLLQEYLNSMANDDQ